MAERVTGRRPAAEGWTTHIPQTLRTMKLSEALRSKGRQRTQEGDVFELDLMGEKGGAGFAFKPHVSKLDKEQQRSQTADRVQFEGQEINEASLDDKSMLDEAVYDFQFEPKATSHSRNGESHIVLIEYASKFLLLRATFRNGAVVVYGGVPANIFARLKLANDNGQSVGATFWDYVRIYARGGLPVGGPYKPGQSNFVQEGSKYPFIYSQKGESAGPRPEQYQVSSYSPMTGKDVRETGLQKQAREQRDLREFEKGIAKGAITLWSSLIKTSPTAAAKTRRKLISQFRHEVQQLSPETLKKLQAVLGENIDQLAAASKYQQQLEDKKASDMAEVQVPRSWPKDNRRDLQALLYSLQHEGS